MDLDEETYAVIRANNEAALKLEAFSSSQQEPKELIMSMESVMEQRRKADLIAQRLRSREAALTRSLGEPDGQS